jgi:hypothetical protein
MTQEAKRLRMRSHVTKKNIWALQEVMRSAPDDWIRDREGLALIPLPEIRIVAGRAAGPQFDEPWARQFPDGRARRLKYVVQLDGRPVKEYYFVSVDGERAELPMPKSAEEREITREQLHIGRIVNDADRSEAPSRFRPCLAMAQFRLERW